MKIGVFDIDNTLIIHGNGSESYYKINENTDFRKLLESKKFDKIYIYTNGTYGHGDSVVKHLNIDDKISFIYGRDNLRNMIKENFMKPHINSFNTVNNSIKYQNNIINTNDHQIYFFDDMEENLFTAHNIGWITILIKPNGNTNEYINYSYSNIYSALINMNI